MKYFTKIGKREFEVEMGSLGSTLELRLAGRTYLVDCATVDPGEKYSILIDGRSFDVTLDGDGRKLALIVDGHAYHAEVEDERERAMSQIAGHGGDAGGVVESVMPGIVRKIFIEVGQEVKAGDRLLILEAMKMENEIRAESAGIVERVLIAEGQTVDGGQPLVSLKGIAAG